MANRKIRGKVLYISLYRHQCVLKGFRLANAVAVKWVMPLTGMTFTPLSAGQGAGFSVINGESLFEVK